jgi:hypothetical protein
MIREAFPAPGRLAGCPGLSYPLADDQSYIKCTQVNNNLQPDCRLFAGPHGHSLDFSGENLVLYKEINMLIGDKNRLCAGKSRITGGVRPWRPVLLHPQGYKSRAACGWKKTAKLF